MINDLSRLWLQKQYQLCPCSNSLIAQPHFDINDKAELILVFVNSFLSITSKNYICFNHSFVIMDSWTLYRPTCDNKFLERFRCFLDIWNWYGIFFHKHRIVFATDKKKFWNSGVLHYVSLQLVEDLVWLIWTSLEHYDIRFFMPPSSCDYWLNFTSWPHFYM